MSSPQTPVVVPLRPASAQVVVPLFPNPHPITSGAVSLEQRESFRRGVALAQRMEAERKPLIEWHPAPGRTGRVTTLALLALVAAVVLIGAFA